MQGIKIDFITNTIIITKGFYEEAQNIGTEEYTALKLAQMENPNMRIAFKSTKAGKSKNVNKGLTYRYMRRFISVLDEENLDTFERVILHYEKTITDNVIVYQHVRDWFLKNYPNHKELIVSSAPQRKEVKNADTEKVLAASRNAA